VEVAHGVGAGLKVVLHKHEKVGLPRRRLHQVEQVARLLPRGPAREQGKGGAG
jgi:hypothetical protein